MSEGPTKQATWPQAHTTVTRMNAYTGRTAVRQATRRGTRLRNVKGGRKGRAQPFVLGGCYCTWHSLAWRRPLALRGSRQGTHTVSLRLKGKPGRGATGLLQNTRLQLEAGKSCIRRPSQQYEGAQAASKQARLHLGRRQWRESQALAEY